VVCVDSDAVDEGATPGRPASIHVALRLRLPLRRSLRRFRLAVRNDPGAIAVVHSLVRVQPARGLESRTADKQVVRAGNDFLVTIGANDLKGQIVVVTHGVGLLWVERENKQRTYVIVCQAAREIVAAVYGLGVSTAVADRHATDDAGLANVK
jgi:hypothetical protein